MTGTGVLVAGRAEMGGNVLLNAWNALERYVVGLLGGIALVLSGFEVVTRYGFPQFAPDWGEEVIVYVVIWGTFLAGSALTEQNRHVRADILVRMLGAGRQRLLELFNAGLGVFFCGAMAWFGWEVVEFAIMLDEHSISSLHFPVALYYLCLPVGMALMTLRFLVRIWELLFRFDPVKHTIQDGDFSHD